MAMNIQKSGDDHMRSCCARVPARQPRKWERTEYAGKQTTGTAKKGPRPARTGREPSRDWRAGRSVRSGVGGCGGAGALHLARFTLGFHLGGFGLGDGAALGVVHGVLGLACLVVSHA